jgi:hypothetical protein
VQPPRRLLALPLLLLALAVPLLSGCGQAEGDSAAVAVAKSGVLGALGEQLKREDDEAEVTELRQRAEQATPEERDEAREADERRALEAADPESSVSPAELAGEGS